ncbi:hypothetical protein D918_02515 [Trichuris suis]|nr:hypothetical protein D918_02515 [Trichuris suis]
MASLIIISYTRLKSSVAQSFSETFVSVETVTHEAPLVYFLKPPKAGSNGNWPTKKVEELEKGSTYRVTPYAKATTLQISQTLTLRAFAKLPQAHLGDKLVIKKSLRIWGQGEARYELPNYCNAVYKVEVLRGKFKLANTDISNQQDSTVWLVSNGGRVWCVSNIPRLRTYEQYGNGVLCLENIEIYRAFKTLADQTKSRRCPT